MDNYKIYVINKESYLDIKGVGVVLNKAVGTLRNTFRSVGFPSHIKNKGRLYFKKDEVIAYKNKHEISEIIEFTESK